MQRANVSGILKKHSGHLGDLISTLQDIQVQYGYLQEEALRAVSEETGYSLVDIYGVATFYKSFSLKPRGEHLVSACLGTACHVRGAPTIVKELEKQLGINAGETTSDRGFTLETVNCLGACALGPIVVVDGHYFSKVTKADVEKIISKTREGLDKVEIKGDPRVFAIQVNCPRCNHSLADTEYLIDDHPSVRLTVSFGRMHGWIRMSSLYGSYTIESKYEIPLDTIMNFFCPHCHAELTGASNCSICSAPMIPMIVRGGGMVQICARRGCKGHMLDLDGSNF
jgi:NADH:ubiquinone oxidoreductase subunit E